jgi:hypothetical protein
MAVIVVMITLYAARLGVSQSFSSSKCSVVQLLPDYTGNSVGTTMQEVAGSFRAWVVMSKSWSLTPWAPNDVDVRLAVFLLWAKRRRSTSKAPNFFFCIRSLCHSVWASLRLGDSGFGQNCKPRTGEIPLLFSIDPKGSFRQVNYRQSTHHLAFDKPVELHWWAHEWLRIQPGLESRIHWTWAGAANILDSTTDRTNLLHFPILS